MQRKIQRVCATGKNYSFWRVPVGAKPWLCARLLYAPGTGNDEVVARRFPEKIIMKSPLLLGRSLALLTAFSLAFSAVIVRAAVVVNESIPFDGFTVFVECADGGNGEEVVFTGDLHVLLAVTLDANGGFHAKEHFQPQGLTGIGQSTGDKYQATGVTQDTFNGKVGSTFTYVNNFRIIGQGPGNNYLVHETFHVTVNANGTTTVVHDNLTIDCK